jgi:homoprotocatechuate degradation regulator HpaR
MQLNQALLMPNRLIYSCVHSMKNIRPSLTLALLQAREAAMSHFRPTLNAHGLTEQQWRVIRILYQHDVLESNQLAELACILKPSLTGILNRMQQQGLIHKNKDRHDQRINLISLTEAGLLCFEEQSSKMEDSYHMIQAQFGPEKLQQLMQLLNDLAQLKQ